MWICLTGATFRVAELLAGKESDPISCSLHAMDWYNPLEDGLYREGRNLENQGE